MPTQRDIEVEFWTSPAVVPAPPVTKLFFQYLLNGPQTNYIGIYRFSVDTCRRDTGLTDEEIEASVRLGSVPQEHDGDPFLMFDRDTGLIWVVKRLAHTFRDGRVPNAKQLKGIARMLDILPRCTLLHQACQRYRALGEPFASTADKIQIPLPIPVSIPLPIGHANSGLELENQPQTNSEPKPDDPPDPEGPDPVPGPSVLGPCVPGKTRVPDAAAGASGDSSGDGSPPSRKMVLDKVQTGRLALIARDLEQQVKETKDRFNPHECLQRMVNHHLPVDIGIRILLSCRDAHRKEPIKNRWAWTQKVLDREFTALHIRLMEAEHQARKNQKPNLEALGTVFRRIGAQQPEGDGEAFS
jgi:hypothetical protein